MLQLGVTRIRFHALSVHTPRLVSCTLQTTWPSSSYLPLSADDAGCDVVPTAWTVLHCPSLQPIFFFILTTPFTRARPMLIQAAHLLRNAYDFIRDRCRSPRLRSDLTTHIFTSAILKEYCMNFHLPHARCMSRRAP
jgi:hypothetical protein